MIPAQRNKYLETSIQTATPAQLLIMLYDGAIRFCRQAIEALKADRPQEAHNALVRAQDIISEFTITLDRNAEISSSLLQLYEYFHQRLVQANVQKSVEPVEEVAAHLMELKETWVRAAIQLKNGTDQTVTASVKHG